MYNSMIDTNDRLLRCFSSIFPTLTPDEIHAADIEQLVDTDSLAGVTLLAMIGQEFGIELSMADMLELRTFPKIQRYLQSAV